MIDVITSVLVLSNRSPDFLHGLLKLNLLRAQKLVIDFHPGFPFLNRSTKKELNFPWTRDSIYSLTIGTQFDASQRKTAAISFYCAAYIAHGLPRVGLSDSLLLFTRIKMVCCLFRFEPHIHPPIASNRFRSQEQRLWYMPSLACFEHGNLAP